MRGYMMENQAGDEFTPRTTTSKIDIRTGGVWGI